MKRSETRGTVRIFPPAPAGQRNDLRQLAFRTIAGTDALSGNDCFFYLGTETNNNTWCYLDLALETKMKTLLSSWSIVKVNGIRIWCKDLYVDDIILSGGSMERTYQLVPGAAIGGYLSSVGAALAGVLVRGILSSRIEAIMSFNRLAIYATFSLCVVTSTFGCVIDRHGIQQGRWRLAAESPLPGWFSNGAGIPRDQIEVDIFTYERGNSADWKMRFIVKAVPNRKLAEAEGRGRFHPDSDPDNPSRKPGNSRWIVRVKGIEEVYEVRRDDPGGPNTVAIVTTSLRPNESQ